LFKSPPRRFFGTNDDGRVAGEIGFDIVVVGIESPVNLVYCPVDKRIDWMTCN